MNCTSTFHTSSRSFTVQRDKPSTISMRRLNEPWIERSKRESGNSLRRSKKSLEFTDVLSLLTLGIDTTFELIHCLRVCRLPEMNPANPGVSLLSQCQNRSARNRAKIGALFWGEGSKNGTGGTVQKWITEVRGRRDKGIQKWSRKFIDILMLVFNMFPRRFSAKDVVKLTGRAENALRSKSKSAAVHQKETKLNEKGRLASAIMSGRCCIDHPQKWKILYLSID